MNFSRSLIAGLLISVLSAAAPQLAHANKGTVTHLSGVLSAKKPDGTIRVLAERSEVAAGEVLTSERNTYANVRFADGGQMTLKPASSVRIEKFAYQQDKPQEDSFAISLLTGGLRMVSGIVGARSRAKFQVGTQTATIGIRGTTFNIDDCVNAAVEGCEGREPGIYVGVTNGSVELSNAEGRMVLQAGQFSRVARGAAPRPVANPGFLFTPPPSFLRSASSGPRPTECVVRR
jgi:ferric-dicitrate binding protein FerR (iron transport regulator)